MLFDGGKIDALVLHAIVIAMDGYGCEREQQQKEGVAKLAGVGCGSHSGVSVAAAFGYGQYDASQRGEESKFDRVTVRRYATSP